METFAELQLHQNSIEPFMKTIQFLALVAVVLASSCRSNNEAPDSLNNSVPLETQMKVYAELRSAMNLVGAEALAAYPKSGMPEGGAEEFRALQDSLRETYWATVCDTNQVALNYGDSIWTKGVKEKWPAAVKGR